MSDSDDPVVSEMDLFLSSDMSTKSLIIQFPLVSRKEGCPNIEQVSFNSKNKSYKIMVAPPQDIYTGMDLKSHYLQTNKIYSPQPFALGVIRDGQVHLTPITSIYQARPSDLFEEETTTSKDQEPDSKAIDFTEGTDITKFTSKAATDVSSQMSALTYKDNLTGMRCDFSADLIEQISENTLSSRPPREQLYYVLYKNRTIFFDDVVQSLILTAYSEELLDVLFKYAYYVQSRWVIKSEEIRSTELPVNLRAARNFAIVIFSYKKYLTPALIKKFLALFSIQSSDLKTIFDRLATNTKDKVTNENRVVFKYTEKPEFEQRHNCLLYTSPSPRD